MVCADRSCHPVSPQYECTPPRSENAKHLSHKKQHHQSEWVIFLQSCEQDMLQAYQYTTLFCIHLLLSLTTPRGTGRWLWHCTRFGLVRRYGHYGGEGLWVDTSRYEKNRADFLWQIDAQLYFYLLSFPLIYCSSLISFPSSPYILLFLFFSPSTQMIGTPYYMSPELFSNMVRALSPRRRGLWYCIAHFRLLISLSLSLSLSL